jgi:hypothetical protein
MGTVAAAPELPSALPELGRGMLERDFTAVEAELAETVWVRSPITSRFRFEGRAEVIELLRIVRESLPDLRYTSYMEQGDTSVLAFSARVGAHELDGIDLMRRGTDGRISEITVYMRPQPAVAALAGALGPKLARRPGRVRSLVTRVLSAPLARMIGVGDRLAIPLVLKPWRRAVSRAAP